MNPQAQDETNGAQAAQHGTETIKESNESAGKHDVLDLADNTFGDVRAFENQSNRNDDQSDGTDSSCHTGQVNSSKSSSNAVTRSVSLGHETHHRSGDNSDTRIESFFHFSTFIKTGKSRFKVLDVSQRWNTSNCDQAFLISPSARPKPYPAKKPTSTTPKPHPIT